MAAARGPPRVSPFGWLFGGLGEQHAPGVPVKRDSRRGLPPPLLRPPPAAIRISPTRQSRRPDFASSGGRVTDSPFTQPAPTRPTCAPLPGVPSRQPMRSTNAPSRPAPPNVSLAARAAPHSTSAVDASTGAPSAAIRDPATHTQMGIQLAPRTGMLVVCVWAIAVAQIDLPVEFPVWGMIDQALFTDLIMDNGKAGAREVRESRAAPFALCRPIDLCRKLNTVSRVR